MQQNVEKFFELYNSDEQLKAKVADAVDNYPGCLEIREALAQATLLPIAEEMGLGFTIDELRTYEKELKKKRQQMDDDEYFSQVDDDRSYWLLERGWTSKEASVCSSFQK